jgi:hypothetical protein
MKKKIDHRALRFLREAVSEHFQREVKTLAANIYLFTKNGEEFEKNNPGKDHHNFGWAEEYKLKLAELEATHKTAVEYIDSIDPWK